MVEPDRAESARPAGLQPVPGLPPGSAALAEVLPEAVVVADQTGVILFANGVAERLLRWAPGRLAGQPLVLLIPPRLRAAHEAGFEAVVNGRELAPGPLRVSALRADGTEIPLDVLLSPWRSTGGRRLVVGVLRDARERAELEQQSLLTGQLLEVLAEETAPAEMVARLLAGLGQSLDWTVTAMWRVDDRRSGPAGVAGSGADPGSERGGGLVVCERLWQRPERPCPIFAAATLGRQMPVGPGWPGRVVASGQPAWITDVAGDPDFRRAPAAAADGLSSAFAFPIRTRRRILGVIELFSAEPRQPDPPLLATTATIGSRLGEFLERAEAEAQRDELMVALRAAQRTQQFLLDATRVLAETTGYREAVEQLAALAVPLLGDICLIDVVDGARLVRMAARHADPARQPLVDRLRQYPPEATGRHPVAEASTGGRSIWASRMSPEFLHATTQDEQHLRLVLELGFDSYLTVPLVARKRTLGTVTLVSCNPDRRLGEADLTLAEELAGQVAAVVDNARLLEREHEMAHLLQRSLLPPRIPAVPGLTIAVRYRPASEGAEVGGDWYDVIPLPGGATGLAVGDVAGHDMAAASMMGQLRAGLRAFATAGLGPADALLQLHRFLGGLEQQRIATAMYGRYEPATGRLVLASAGHLPPMLLRRDGSVRQVPVRPGPPLGAGEAIPETVLHVEPGDTVLLYTDGLVERRRLPVTDGLDLLQAVLAEIGPVHPEKLADRVLAGMPPDQDDDIAVLAATITTPEPP